MTTKGLRAYVGTKNNYTEDDIEALRAWAHAKCTYLVYGEEVGAQGTPHLQIYMEFKNQMTMSAVNKKLFPLWLGARQGKPKVAAGYCKKGGATEPRSNNADWSCYYAEPYGHPPNENETDAQPWKGEEFGTISEQGKRTDIDQTVHMLVEEKATIREVALAHPAQYVKYHRGLRDLRSLVLGPRSLDGPPHVVVLWGPTLSGKTRDAHIKYWPDEPAYVWRPSNGQWWDGYDGEKKIIIDEFRGTMIWSDLLGLLDRNEFRAPVKGGFIQIQADKFVITSPNPPARWYRDDHEYDRFAQLERRLTEVHEMFPDQ